MSRKIALLAPVVTGGLFLVSTGASAQLLYCCKDEKHVSHCSDTLPPKCVGRAYTVRGRDGKLVKEVGAPLTPEQRKAREELEKKKQAEEAARKEQALRDRALLATYGSEAEIDKARERAEKDVEAGVRETQTKLAAVEKRKAALTDKNVIRERMSPDEQQKKTAELDHEISTLRDLLESKKKDLDGVRQKFAEDKRRYVEIKNRSPVR